MIWQIITTGIVVITALTLSATLQEYHLFTVRSGSMEPTIQTGAIIVIRKQFMPRYDVGDIITFYTTQKLVTHRVIEVITSPSKIQYRTKGDANSTVDHELISHQQVVGKTAITVPLLGYVFTWLKTKTGFSFIILLPATTVVLQELYTIQKIWAAVRKKNSTIPTISLSMLVGICITIPLLTHARLTTQVSIPNSTITTAAVFTTPTPSPNPMPTSDSCPSITNVTHRNQHTGPHSSNTNTTTITSQCDYNHKSTTTINNQVDISITTSENTATNNTQTSNLTSGDVTINITDP